MEKRKLYAPRYYSEFSCIADRCRHSCCIGWEIDVDEETLCRYESLAVPYGNEIRESIEMEDTPHFRLGVGERCPHLNARGLCRIIMEVGEDALCDICREHPRFYHDTPRGREVGVGMACEEACRLILTSDGYADFLPIGDADCDTEGLLDDVLARRERIYAILSDRETSYFERLQTIASEFGVDPSDFGGDDEWRARFAALEYLDDRHRALFARYSSKASVPWELEAQLERMLAYLVFRHCTEVCDEAEYRASVGFCLLCERLLASIACSEGVRNAAELIGYAQTVSEEIEYSEDNTDALKAVFWNVEQ